MGSAAVTNDFSNGTIGDADEVDQNFADLVNFINSHLIHDHRLGEVTGAVVWTPVAATDTGASTTMADWFTLGSVTVPAWATQARYLLSIGGYFWVGSSSNNEIRLVVSPAIGAEKVELAAIATRQNVSLAGTLVGLTAGAKTVRVQYDKIAGAGTMRLDDASHASCLFWWMA